MKKKIIWIASYPKSGNTWFRAFLTALFQNGQIDINDLYSKYIYSSKAIFENETDLDPYLLYNSESQKLIPSIFGQMADSVKENSAIFVKIHDKFRMIEKGIPILPMEQTQCVIYLVRNPLDVSISLSNHLDISIDNSIGFMNSENSKLAKEKKDNNYKPQFPQQLGTWSDHVNSWVSQQMFPILVIRYEDLLSQPEIYFKKAINYMKLEFSDKYIQKAIEVCRFEKLQEQEKKKRFNENPNQNKLFFNIGKAANWKNKLTDSQILRIVEKHSQLMKKYDYLNDL